MGTAKATPSEQDYTIEGFASDVAWMSQQLGLERPVVVGHSLGGIVALALATARPELVSGVVALDLVLVPPADRAVLMGELFARLRTEEHALAGRTVGAGHFHQLEVPDQVNAMIERFLVLAIKRPTKLVQEMAVTSVGRRAMSPMSRCRPGPRADGAGTQPPQVLVLATARDNLDP